jgi:hypothetical protein
MNAKPRTLKAVSFSLLPFWRSYEGFLFYHLTMGIALSMISGGDVALIWDSYLADGGEKSRGAAVLGNATFASQMGTATSALLGGAEATPGEHKPGVTRTLDLAARYLVVKRHS